MVVKKFVKKVLLVLLIIFGIYFAIGYFYSDKLAVKHSPLSVYFASSDSTSNKYAIRDDPGIFEAAFQSINSDLFKPIGDPLNADPIRGNVIENKRDETLTHDKWKSRPFQNKAPEYDGIQAAEKAIESEDIKHTAELAKSETPQKVQNPPQKQPIKPAVEERKNEPDPQAKEPSKPGVKENKPQPESPKMEVEKSKEPQAKKAQIPKVDDKAPDGQPKNIQKPGGEEEKPIIQVKPPARPAKEENKPSTGEKKENINEPSNKKQVESDTGFKGQTLQVKGTPKPGAGTKKDDPTIKEQVKSEIGVKGEAPTPKQAPKPGVGTKKADPPIKDSPAQQQEGGKQLTWAETAYSESRNFQAADGVSLFVYSAYWDADNHIRFFGIVERVNYHPKLTCHLWATNPPGQSEIYNSTDIGIIVLPEHHSKKYTAGYVICRLPPGVSKQNPLLVSLSVERGGKHQNTTLLIHQREKWRSKFTLCVPPLFNRYNRVGAILEMIELNRILGATKFFFYDFDIGPGVKEVLNHYKRKGIVEIINWSLPTNTLAIGGTGRGMDIHYFGQLSAMNDCVYRNRYQSDYVVLTDLDEFVVPNITSNMSTWGELISHRKKVNPDFSVFWIRNVFFRLEWVKKEDLVFQRQFPKQIYTVLSARYREDEWCDYGDKSKNIVDPLGVKIVGIHNIWEKAGPRDLVPGEEATLLHFRSRVYPQDPRKRIRDEAVLNRFGSDLILNIQRVWDEIVKSRAPR